MRACTYLNVFAGTVMFGLMSFAACGGAQSETQAPSAASSADPSNEVSTAAKVAPAAATGAASSPASPSSAAPAAALPTPPADRSMNDIRAIVAGNRDGFRACYDRAQKTHPGIKGTFMLKFVLNPDGSVKSAEADPAKSEIHAPELETCAVSTLRGLKFPPSRRGMESTVNYPFDFNPKGVSRGDAGAP
jgi:TonB family protein